MAYPEGQSESVISYHFKGIHAASAAMSSQLDGSKRTTADFFIFYYLELIDVREFLLRWDSKHSIFKIYPTNNVYHYTH